MNKMIPSESIHVDKNGNAVIGKNLEINGTTKLNGGIEPIHNYEIQADISGYSLIVLFEKYDSINQTYCAFGFIKDEGGSLYPGVFDYSVNNGVVTYFNGAFENKIFNLSGGTITVSEISTTTV